MTHQVLNDRINEIRRQRLYELTEISIERRLDITNKAMANAKNVLSNPDSSLGLKVAAMHAVEYSILTCLAKPGNVAHAELKTLEYKYLLSQYLTEH